MPKPTSLIAGLSVLLFPENLLQKLKEPGTVCLVDRRSVGAFRDRKGKRLAVQRLQTGQGLGKLRLIKLVGDVVEGTDGDEAVAQGYLLCDGGSRGDGDARTLTDCGDCGHNAVLCTQNCCGRVCA